MRMKKWLLGCLLLAAVLCLTGMTPKAEASESGTITATCSHCKKSTECTFIRYIGKRVGYEFDENKHWREYKCNTCNTENTSLDDLHIGGDETPTCTTGKTCSKCNWEYGKLGHDWSEWSPKGNGTHSRTCQREDCGAVDTASCSGDSSATCSTLGTCTTCQGQYYGGHSWSSSRTYDSEKHWHSCIYCSARNGEEDHYVVGAVDSRYLKSEATCVSPAEYYKYCAFGCGYVSEDIFLDPWNGPNPNNHDLVTREAKAPTCTEIGWEEYQACQREGCTYTTSHTEFPALNHDLVHHDAKAATCTEKGWGAYDTCQREGCDYTTYAELPALNHDLVHHDAQAPTCTEKGWNAYDTCQREGCDYTTYTEIPALNHDLVHHDAKTPTCTEIGWKAYDSCIRCDYTTYVELSVAPDNHALIHVKAQAPTCANHGWDAYDICQRCGYTTFKELPALGHWYGEWTPNEDGTQVATCQRGCGHKAKVKCAEEEYALPMGENEEAYEFTLCPVCGHVSENVKLALVEKVTAKAVTRWLPAGEPVLRLGTLENGELVLIAGFEYAGQLTQPTGQVQFTLPAEHLEGFTLTVITPDGTETPLDYTTEKAQSTFTLDFTNTKTPTILIHLTPEA